MSRWASADVDLGAVEHNVRVLAGRAAPAEVWAVVKADGYGHGAVEIARAARRAGAAGLCVALVDEGVTLRGAGVDGPILVLSEQPADRAPAIVEADLIATVYSDQGIAALADAATAVGRTPHPVHLKVDTGMHRVGAEPAEAVRLADAVAARATLRLDGVFTHLAIADEPDDPYTAGQLDQFDAVLADLDAAGHRPPRVHAANSAGALAHPRARRDLVRVGIACYGLWPGPAMGEWCTELRPALSLRARVSHLQRRAAGERLSYGLRHRLERDATIATLPLGYADGVTRRLFATGGAVLIRGRRRPIVGVVTMDQLLVDCGDDEIEIGDEAVLIGRQGSEEIGAQDWADRLGTIGYEVVCGISPRVPRRYHRPAQ